MRIIDVKQGETEWFEARRGIATSSNFSKIIDTKGKPSKQRTKYLYKTVGEKLAGITENGYENAAMIRGKELESDARDLYEFMNGVEVSQVGFCLRDDLQCGASPDGLVGEKGLLEIKAPLLSTHIEYLVKNELPAKYYQQIMGQLFVTGRKWVDFFSYFPGIKPLIIRVERDEKFIKMLEVELSIFCEELNKLENKLRR